MQCIQQKTKQKWFCGKQGVGFYTEKSLQHETTFPLSLCKGGMDICRMNDRPLSKQNQKIENKSVLTGTNQRKKEK